MDYTTYSDEELIEKLREGNAEIADYIMEKYKPLVRKKTNAMYLIGGETEDLIQEGMIGLFKAIQSFDLEKNNSFKTFANLCIERQLISAIKTSNRQKHIPLNSSFSLNTSAFDENDDTTVIEVLDTNFVEDPLDTITKREYFESIESQIDKTLSSFERQVLDRYVQGESYVDIAQKLDSPVKSIDNAIQRIRKKAMKCLKDED